MSSTNRNNQRLNNLVDTMYTKIAGYLDRQIARHDGETPHPFWSRLAGVRNYYLQLPAGKRRVFTALLSFVLVLTVATLFTFSPRAGYGAAAFWITFVALNKMPGVAEFIRSISEWSVRMIFFFLPSFGLAEVFAWIARNTAIILCAFYWGTFLAPFYLLYLGVRLVVGSAPEAAPVTDEAVPGTPVVATVSVTTNDGTDTDGNQPLA